MMVDTMAEQQEELRQQTLSMQGAKEAQLRALRDDLGRAESTFRRKAFGKNVEEVAELKKPVERLRAEIQRVESTPARSVVVGEKARAIQKRVVKGLPTKFQDDPGRSVKARVSRSVGKREEGDFGIEESKLAKPERSVVKTKEVTLGFKQEPPAFKKEEEVVFSKKTFIGKKGEGVKPSGKGLVLGFGLPTEKVSSDVSDFSVNPLTAGVVPKGYKADIVSTYKKSIARIESEKASDKYVSKMDTLSEFETALDVKKSEVKSYLKSAKPQQLFSPAWKKQRDEIRTLAEEKAELKHDIMDIKLETGKAPIRRKTAEFFEGVGLTKLTLPGEVGFKQTVPSPKGLKMASEEIVFKSVGERGVRLARRPQETAFLTASEVVGGYFAGTAFESLVLKKPPTGLFKLKEVPVKKSVGDVNVRLYDVPTGQVQISRQAGFVEAPYTTKVRDFLGMKPSGKVYSKFGQETGIASAKTESGEVLLGARGFKSTGKVDVFLDLDKPPIKQSVLASRGRVKLGMDKTVLEGYGLEFEKVGDKGFVQQSVFRGKTSITPSPKGAKATGLLERLGGEDQSLALVSKTKKEAIGTGMKVSGKLLDEPLKFGSGKKSVSFTLYEDVGVGLKSKTPGKLTFVGGKIVPSEERFFTSKGLTLQPGFEKGYQKGVMPRYTFSQRQKARKFSKALGKVKDVGDIKIEILDLPKPKPLPKIEDSFRGKSVPAGIDKGKFEGFGQVLEGKQVSKSKSKPVLFYGDELIEMAEREAIKERAGIIKSLKPRPTPKISGLGGGVIGMHTPSKPIVSVEVSRVPKPITYYKPDVKTGFDIVGKIKEEEFVVSKGGVKSKFDLLPKISDLAKPKVGIKTGGKVVSILKVKPVVDTKPIVDTKPMLDVKPILDQPLIPKIPKVPRTPWTPPPPGVPWTPPPPPPPPGIVPLFKPFSDLPSGVGKRRKGKDLKKYHPSLSAVVFGLTTKEFIKDPTGVGIRPILKKKKKKKKQKQKKGFGFGFDLGGDLF